MTQEEKQLLLNDICARLPYGAFIHYHWSREGKTIDEDRELDFSDVETLKYNIENPQNYWCEISWKPYLRPMSSMTEEERKIYIEISSHLCGEIAAKTMIDWLNKKGFDYSGLIPMGLALEAKEGMYEVQD